MANGTFGSVLLNDKAVRQAHNLGRHVAGAMGKKWEEMEFKGEHNGTCPVCHLDMVVVNDDQTVTCAVCGTTGVSKSKVARLK